MENWDWVRNYEGHYQISDKGGIRSFKNGKVKNITPHLNEKGYPTVCLCKEGEKHNHRLHRLVAEAFVANPDNKPEVHHIDGNKLNNCADNLIWVERKEHNKATREKAIVEAGLKIPLVVRIFEDKQFGDIRYLEIEGDFWFVAADVCRILEIQNPRDAVSSLEDDEKMTVANPDRKGGEGAQTFNVVNEPGLYRLIFKSRKPEAKKFQRKVYHEILPSIRKIGEYKINQPKKKKTKADNLTVREKINLLKELMNITVDDNLRDDLIRQTAYLIRNA